MINHVRIRRLWKQLTAPAPTLTDEHDRIRARLMASMLLLVAPISAVSLLVVALIAPMDEQTPIRLILTVVTTVVGLTAYAISRTHHYRMAVYVLIVLSISSTLAGFIALAPENAPAASNALYFFSIPVIIGGVFLPLRLTAVIVVLNAGLTLLIGWLQPVDTAYLTAGPLIFNMTFSPLVLLAFHHFSISERSQEARSQKELMKSRLLSTELESERQLNQLKDKFISTVSHEFRTPLATILSSSEILQLYGHKLNDEKREVYFGKINNEVQRMAQMVDDVLTISKVSAGSINFVPAPVNLSSMCRELAANCADDQHRIIFESDLPDETPVILDQNLVEGALKQVLSNAVQYSPQGSAVYLRVARQNSDIVFHIRDHGMGIPADDRERIFEAFQRGSNTTTMPGTGLGLRIAAEYAELHGGKITCDSVEGEGSTFTIYVPLIEPERMMDA